MFSRRLLFIFGFLCFSVNYSYAYNTEDFKHHAFRNQLLTEFPHLPSFEAPCSQLCTFEQFQSEQCLYWFKEMNVKLTFHRKYWEWCYILQVLSQHGKLGEGKRGIGFGVGKEPLPSVFAKYGCSITATDQSAESAIQKGWLNSSEQPFQLEELYRPDICSREVYFSRVSYEEADMNAIPVHFEDFDFTWSSCSLEHLGTIEKGIEFILNSLHCLKKGGIAVHTTEFNLVSNTDTVLSGPTVLYRKQDLERLIHAITELGHTVIPLNLNPGIAPLDVYVDWPPYSVYGHLKLALLDYVATSVGIIVIKN